ncbi:endonuclease/exonuclease/phosphatase family protein [uncultured Psychroserpens sp.]|uniref:endonuclease/exonuclease/phosphatase family protein n=1 Tax=uncultured Psychroserpens sp. TaxID=255436 RepID=UPI0026247F84|nr:endonuclease/exonuclease/phosphatase family protein [uncultured Psychroserpens sp.]
MKDYLFPLSIVFYASPLPLLILSGLLLLGLYFRRKTYRIALLIVVCLLSLHWLGNYYLSSKPLANKGNSKILFWNLAKREQLSISSITNQVNVYQPEILAFVEAPHTTLKNLDALKTALSNYNFITLKGAMLVAAKGDITLLDFNLKEDAYKVNLLDISTKTSHIKLMITDLTANVFVNKKAPLEFVVNYAQNNDVDLIVGDFNAPYESTFFKPYESNFTSFHHFSNGFTATWPLGIPLLELDHIWLSKRHEPIKLTKHYHNASDHAMLISDFRLRN